MGKIAKQKMPKQGHRGRLGVSGASAHRSKSRERTKPTIQRQRALDYVKFDKLKATIEDLTKLEASDWIGMSAPEAKAKAKELKLLRAKLEMKERKRG